MGEWIDIPLATQVGDSASTFISDAELTNLMVVPNPPGSLRPFSVLNTPGLSNGVGSGSGTMRGIIAHGNYVWFVRGTELYRYDGTTSTLVGTVASSGLVRMTGAGSNAIVIAVDGGAYFATTSAVNSVSLPSGSAWAVTYQDGYTIYTRKDTDEFYISSLDDPETIGALDFSTADALPDVLVGCVSNHRELVLFGKTHIEFWYNSGNADFPFVRSSPGVAERGCFAGSTIAKYDNSVFFLGEDRRVYRLEGYRPVPISTPWVERLISTTLSPLSNACASVHVEQGRPVYAINSGNSGLLVYDIMAGIWHVRTYGTSAADGTCKGTCTFEATDIAGGKRSYMALDLVSASDDVFLINESAYRDSFASSTDITRTMTCPAVDLGGQRVFMEELHARAESVTGTATYSYSDDGGSNYTSHDAASMATDRLRWQRCGSFFRRIVRLTFAANARIAIDGLRARISVGA